MPIYSAKIMGRTKSVLVRAESAAKASALLVSLDALTAAEMADALESGEKVWKGGDPFPADEVAEVKPDAKPETDPPAKPEGEKGEHVAAEDPPAHKRGAKP